MNSTNFENHYKSRNLNGRLARINSLKESRTDRRSVLRNAQRNIEVETTEKKTDIVEDRRIRLLKWKANKEQMKQLEKQKQKPVFKVYHLDNKIENITTNKQTKNHFTNVQSKIDTGIKRITRKNKNAQKPNENNSIVPAGYLFKPPQNILPLVDTHKNINQRITRSQKLHVTPPAPLPTRSRLKKETKKSKQIVYDFPIKNAKMRNESLFESISEEPPEKVPLNEILDISLTTSNRYFSTSMYGETSNVGIRTRKTPSRRTSNVFNVKELSQNKRGSSKKTTSQQVSKTISQNDEISNIKKTPSLRVSKSNNELSDINVSIKKTPAHRVSKSNNIQKDELSDINASIKKTPGRSVSKINVEDVSMNKSTKKTPTRRVSKSNNLQKDELSDINASIKKTPGHSVSKINVEDVSMNKSTKKTPTRRVSKSNNLQKDELSDINASIKKTPGRRVSKINVEDVSTSINTKKTPARRVSKSNDELSDVNVSIKKTPGRRVSKINVEDVSMSINTKKTPARRVSKSNDELSDVNVSIKKTPGRRVSKINVEDISVSKSAKKTPSRRSILPNIEATTSTKETPNRRVSSASKNNVSMSTINEWRPLKSNTSSNSMSSPLSDEVFLSPFVTTARGKRNAREEYKTKISLGIVTSPRDDNDCLLDETFTMSPPDNNYIQAKMFENKLDSTIIRLQIECNKWDEIVALEDFNASQEIKDEIDSTVGQTRLLIAKKFEQFRGLIRNCMNKEGELPVTPKDLEGFWDMIYIQVENIDERFKKLLKIKENNWQEVKEPLAIPAVLKRKVFAKSGGKKAAGPSTGIKALIEAARNKRRALTSASSAPEVLMQKSFALIDSTTEENPQQSDVIRTPKHSLLTNVISSEKNKYTRRVSSPGLAIMKATSIAKCLEKAEPFTNTPVSYINMNATPGRSILKTPKTEKRKSQRRTKAVLFPDFESPAGKENAVPVADLIDLTTPKTEERRRSKRLSLKFV